MPENLGLIISGIIVWLISHGVENHMSKAPNKTNDGMYAMSYHSGMMIYSWGFVAFSVFFFLQVSFTSNDFEMMSIPVFFLIASFTMAIITTMKDGGQSVYFDESKIIFENLDKESKIEWDAIDEIKHDKLEQVILIKANDIEIQVGTKMKGVSKFAEFLLSKTDEAVHSNVKGIIDSIVSESKSGSNPH